MGVGDVGLPLPDLLMTLQLRRGVDHVVPQCPKPRGLRGGGEGSQWEQWAAAA